jgi:hypothetical protein
LLQVVDDDVLKVVDVLLIGVNSWWIHPLREITVLCLGEDDEPKKDDEPILWTLLTMHMGGARSDDWSCSIPCRLASRKTHCVNTDAQHR